MATASTLDLNNIQGDILQGLPKKGENFFFFTINPDKVQQFCIDLAELVPLITTAAQCQDDRIRIAKEKQRAASAHTTPVILDMSGVNIAFSQKGLSALSINDNMSNDPLDPFKGGMLADAANLNDDPTHNSWDQAFTKDIHGVILITGSSHPQIDAKFNKVKKIFAVGKPNASIKEVKTLSGHTRPGDISGHEHFGFADGISQPAVDGLDALAIRGQDTVHQGIILTGREGDNVRRPRWALDGSFLAFRYLKQKVPEFDDFLERNALPVPTPIPDGGPTGAELLGARLVGRWKSGAPIDLTPLKDDPDMGADPSRNNSFIYDPFSQVRCPYAAHTRKTLPRSDLSFLPTAPATATTREIPGGSEIRRIFRRGIQFGPEVTADEKTAKKSSDDPKLERGLLFACYQSNLKQGFQFIQKSWANNILFPPGKNGQPFNAAAGLNFVLPVDKVIDNPAQGGTGIGFDPLIGVAPPGQTRFMVGTNPQVANAADSLTLDQDWVITKGGEYFFAPSVSALADTFAQVV